MAQNIENKISHSNMGHTLEFDEMIDIQRCKYLFCMEDNELRQYFEQSVKCFRGHLTAYDTKLAKELGPGYT